MKIEILEAGGEVIHTLDEPGRKAGFNRVAWSLTLDPPRPRMEEDSPASEFFGPPRGPRVLPGTYTVRLTVDGESREKPVEVALDPLIDTPPGDLERAFEASKKLWRMQSAVNDALRDADALHAQLTARRDSMKLLEQELPDEVEERWKGFEEALGEILGVLVKDPEKPFWSLGPRLSERLGDLFRRIDGAYAAPTVAQNAYLGELADEYRQAMESCNGFLEEEVVGFNRDLAANGVPALAVPAKIESGE